MRIVLALLFALWSTLVFGQSPTPVPALPDTPRLTQYSINTSQCACAVNFAIYGDSTDVDEWLQVFIGTTAYLSTDPVFGWTITSPSGPIGNIARPITNAVLTFNQAQTGIVTILGARRPRRLSQFQENRGVAARDLNQAITDEIAMLREDWDRGKRTIEGQPGEVLNLLPAPTARAGKVLSFDPSGQPTTTPIQSVTSGNVIGPGSSVNGDIACYNGTSGTVIADCTKQSLLIPVSVLAYGAKCDGSTNDSSSIQAAINANPVTLIAFPTGTCIATDITISTVNAGVFGQGAGVTTIKRPANDNTNNCVISVTTASGIFVGNLTVDGNAANEVDGANGICVQSSARAATIENVIVQNSKAVNGFGNGIAITGTSDSSNNTFTSVRNSKSINNNADGINVSVADNVRIVNNELSTNGGNGVTFINFVFPPVNNSQVNNIISSNTMYGNTGDGVFVCCSYTGGTSMLPIEAPSQASRFFSITGNFTGFNSGYGFALYGQAMTVSGNVITSNGVNGCPGTGCGGFDSLGDSVTFTGNTVINNKYWGSDFGGSSRCVVSGNTYEGQNSPSTYVDINLGSTIGCVVTGNTILQLSTGGIGMFLNFQESGGGDFFTVTTTGPTIANNIINLNNLTGNIGILNSFQAGTSVFNNKVQGSAAPNLAFQLYNAIGYLSQRGNLDENQANGAAFPTLTAASTLIIPDAGDTFYVNGTTNITDVQSWSQSQALSSVDVVQMSNNGSGYTQASPGSVSFSGGTCVSQPAGTPIAKNDGTIQGVSFSSHGNCSVAPNAVFSGGAGTGAAGTPILGANNNAEGREITLIFNGNLTISTGTHIKVSSSHNTTGGTSILKLVGQYNGSVGYWNETSFRQ